MKRIISYSDDVLDVVDYTTATKHLNLIRTDQTALITTYLEAAIRRCSNYLGFEIRRAVCDYYFTKTVEDVLTIPARILSITSVKYLDENYADQSMVLNTDYRYANIGQHIPEIVILETPATFADTDYAYRVRVVEGWYTSRTGTESTADFEDMMPADVVTAILLNLTHLYENRNDVNVINTYQLAVGSEHFLFPYSKLQIL